MYLLGFCVIQMAPGVPFEPFVLKTKPAGSDWCDPKVPYAVCTSLVIGTWVAPDMFKLTINASDFNDDLLRFRKF